MLCQIRPIVALFHTAPWAISCLILTCMDKQEVWFYYYSKKNDPPKKPNIRHYQVYFHRRGSYNDHSSQGRHDMLGWKIRQRKLPIYQIHQIFASFFSQELNQSCTCTTAKSVRVKEIKIKFFSFSSIKCEKNIAGGPSLHSFLVQPYLKDLRFFGWFNQARIEELLSCKILCRVL